MGGKKNKGVRVSFWPAGVRGTKMGGSKGKKSWGAAGDMERGGNVLSYPEVTRCKRYRAPGPVCFCHIQTGGRDSVYAQVLYPTVELRM